LLFAHLVTEHGRPVPREELAEVLWAGNPPPTWDKALRVLASKLRAVLSEQGIDGAGALTNAFGCYRLELPAGTWIDLSDATRALHDAERALARDDLAAAKTDGAVAASLTARTFLPGDDGDWAEGKRRELAAVRARALSVLADACLRADEPEEAAAWAEQAIALDPFRESEYRRLMEAHVAAGNRGEALRVYERCRRQLADELGAYPSPETDAVYRELLGNGAAPVAVAVAVRPEPDVSAAPKSTRHGLAAAGVLVAAGIAAIVLLELPGHKAPAVAALRSAGDAIAVIDSSTARPRGSVSLEAPPTAVAQGYGSIWATMSTQNAVARVDPATGDVQQTIPTGRGPAGVAVGGGFVWVANSFDGTVSQIDPEKNGGQVVGNVAVGNGAASIAYGLGGVWVANSIDRTVVRIDPLTNKRGTPLAVGAGSDAIAVGDGALWVTSAASGVVSRVDPRSGTVNRINVGNGPVALAVDRGAVWVANNQDATVSRIDSTSNRVVGTVPVGEGPRGVAVARGGSTVWIANALSGTVSEIDARSNTVVENVPVGDEPRDVTADARGAYVAVQASGAAAHRGGTLTVAVANPTDVYQLSLAKGLDPAYGYVDAGLLSLTNDGLVGYGRSGGTDATRVVPDLAVALPTVSDGGLTYTFQLRPRIRYSTGAAVRTADVRRAIERALLIGGAGTPGSYLTGIVGASKCVEARRCDLSAGVVTHPHSNTVAFHLAAPDPDFLYKLALPMADVVPASTPLRARIPLPATGPYEIAGIDTKRGIVRLTRNPRFRVWSAAAQPEGFPNRIVERYGYTGEAAVRAVESGAADVTADAPDQTWSPSLAGFLRTHYSSRVFSTPIASTTVLWLNTRLAPFDDVRVRRAINDAVDRRRLVAIAGGAGTAAAGCQVLPPNFDGYAHYCPYAFQLARAKRLVQASGTKGEAVTVWFYDIPIGRSNGAYVVSVLRSLGYKARLRLVRHAGPTWRANRQAGVGGWGGDYPSAGNFFGPLFTCRSYTTDPATNTNTSGLCNRRVDAEIARARTLQVGDAVAASRLWAKIDRQVTDLAPWVVLRTGTNSDFVSRRTHNYTTCWLSYMTGTTSACLDQLWVR
jgi:peptide/nickel transport system substrate-binding protein